MVLCSGTLTPLYLDPEGNNELCISGVEIPIEI